MASPNLDTLPVELIVQIFCLHQVISPSPPLASVNQYLRKVWTSNYPYIRDKKLSKIIPAYDVARSSSQALEDETAWDPRTTQHDKDLSLTRRIYKTDKIAFDRYGWWETHVEFARRYCEEHRHVENGWYCSVNLYSHEKENFFRAYYVLIVFAVSHNHPVSKWTQLHRQRLEGLSALELLRLHEIIHHFQIYPSYSWFLHFEPKVAPNFPHLHQISLIVSDVYARKEVDLTSVELDRIHCCGSTITDPPQDQVVKTLAHLG